MTSGAPLENPDAHVLIEAKASSGRDHIRLALGQLLDYVRHTGPLFEMPALAVLVPTRPTDDLMDLLSRSGVDAIWRKGRAFADSVGGRYSTKR